MKSYEVSDHAIKRLRQRVDGYKHATPRKAKASIRRMLNPDILIKKIKRGPATILIGEKLCGICIDNILVTVFKPDTAELAKRGINLTKKEGEEDKEPLPGQTIMQTTRPCVDQNIC